MILSIVGCENNRNDNHTESQNTEQTSQTDNTDNQEPTSGTEQKPVDEYDSYAKISGESIYVNYKTGRRDDNCASSIVFHGTGSDLTILAYDATGSFTGDHTKVLDLINDGRIFKDIAIYSYADFHDYSTTYIIVVNSTENLNVNGISMQKFTGTVKSTDNRTCYTYGYTFVVNNVPCVLAGFVLTETQEQALISSIIAEVDAMVNTIRTER